MVEGAFDEHVMPMQVECEVHVIDMWQEPVKTTEPKQNMFEVLICDTKPQHVKWKSLKIFDLFIKCVILSYVLTWQYT